MGLIQLFQLAFAVTCCYATFQHPFHLSLPHHEMLQPLFPGPQVQVLPLTINTQLFNANPNAYPNFFMNAKPLYTNVKPMPMMMPMNLLKQVTEMKSFKPMKTMLILKPKMIKYFKNPMNSRIPFTYLRTRQYRPQWYQLPPWINRRQPFPRPQTRVNRQRPSFQPQYQLVNDVPQSRQQTFDGFPKDQPDTFSDTLPRHQPPVVYNRRNVDPLNQPSLGQGVRPLSQFPVQPETSQPVQPLVRPLDGEYLLPNVIPDQRRTRWLQTASGKRDNFDSDDDDDDLEKWEKQFDDFDERFEDLLEKKKEGYYDNDDDKMLDKKIYESLDEKTRLRRNMARNRNYLEDFKRSDGKDPKDQEKYFEKLGDNKRQRPQQQLQPRSISLAAKNARNEIKYDEKYFENLKNQARMPNFQSSSSRNSRITSVKPDFENAVTEIKNDEKYFDKKNHHHFKLSPTSRANERGQSFEARRNSNNENNLKRNFASQGSVKASQPIINVESFGRSKNDDKYFERKFDGDKNIYKNIYGEKFIEQELNRRRVQQQTPRANMHESVNSLANHGNRFMNRGQQTIRQVSTTRTQGNENGRERSVVTRLVDSATGLNSEQKIKYKNEKNKYIKNKDEYRRTIAKHLAGIPDRIVPQRQTFQRTDIYRS